MDFHKALATLTRSPVFTAWHKDNNEYYLAHAFIMLDEANKSIWQFGWYNPTKERMVTFQLERESVSHTEEQEVLKKEGSVDKLNPEDIKITPEEALKIADELFEKENGKQALVKKFFIIQHTEGVPMFNITSVLQSFKTFNVKIDSRDGKVVKHSLQDLLAMG